MGVNLVAVCLLVVDGIVLDRRADAVLLDATDVCSAHLSAQERILGEILEVPAAEDVAMDVHTRCKQDIDAIFENFLAHGRCHFLDEVSVPCGCQRSTNWEAGGIESLARAGTGRADTNAGRAVGEDGGRNAESGDGAGISGSTGNKVGHAGSYAAGHGGAAAADQESGLLFQSHGIKDFVDVVLAELGLSHGGYRHEPSSCDQKSFFHKITDY